MTTEPADDPAGRRQLDDVIGAFLEAMDAGAAPDARDWMALHPELAPELAEFLDGQDAMFRLLGTAKPEAGAGGPDETRTLNCDGVDSGPSAGHGPSAERPVGRFGDYELLGELGRGGMGLVLRARQISLDRQVALKMIRVGRGGGADADDLRRFRNEAEAVGALDHPGIVPIYEVGEHRGQPYFTMKLIPGGNLADRLEAGAFEPAEAARLVAEIAEAVHHAHQRGILHRDLKPANILMDEGGRPHVVDFGLARRIDRDEGLTGTGVILGTPGYLAPEQLLGRRAEVTTATDVYGLGAILYALLTGRAPFRGETVMETLRLVRDRPPELPSRLRDRCPRDLEVICLKCLEKAPHRRYGSPRELADDLRRWLAGEPIAARPVGAATRSLLWCRRNPALVALIVTAALGIAGITWSWRVAVKERGEALDARKDAQDRLLAMQKAKSEQDREALRAQVIADFLSRDLLGQTEPGDDGRAGSLTIAEAMDRAVVRLDRGPWMPAYIECEVRYYLARIYHSLGLFARSETQWRKAVELAGRHDDWGPDHAETQTIRANLAHVLVHLKRFEEAERLAAGAVEALVRQEAPDNPRLLQAEDELVAVLRARGKLEEAETLSRRVVEGWRRAHGENAETTLGARLGLADVLAGRGKLEEAEALARETAASYRAIPADRHVSTLQADRTLADILQRRDRLEEAEALLRRCLAAARRLHGDDHPDTLDFMKRLASALGRRSQHAEEQRLIRDARRLERRREGPDHPVASDAARRAN